MTNGEHESTDQGQPDVTFTVDGVTFTTSKRKLTATQLLELAGVDSEDHDLARVVGKGKIEKRHADDDVIQLTPGAAFVSIFTGSTPVV